GAVAHAHLRSRLGRAVRRPVQHAGSPRQGSAAQAGGARPPADPHPARPRLPVRRGPARRDGGAMTLTTRLTAFFLATLAVVRLGFSAALCLLARAHLHRQANERLEAALTTLAAAADVEADGVEWDPHERGLRLGEDAAADQVRWTVHDGRGALVDRSHNLEA